MMFPKGNGLPVGTSQGCLICKTLTAKALCSSAVLACGVPNGWVDRVWRRRVLVFKERSPGGAGCSSPQFDSTPAGESGPRTEGFPILRHEPRRLLKVPASELLLSGAGQDFPHTPGDVTCALLLAGVATGTAMAGALTPHPSLRENRFSSSPPPAPRGFLAENTGERRGRQHLFPLRVFAPLRLCVHGRVGGRRRMKRGDAEARRKRALPFSLPQCPCARAPSR